MAAGVQQHFTHLNQTKLNRAELGCAVLCFRAMATVHQDDINCEKVIQEWSYPALCCLCILRLFWHRLGSQQVCYVFQWVVLQGMLVILHRLSEQPWGGVVAVLSLTATWLRWLRACWLEAGLLGRLNQTHPSSQRCISSQAWFYRAERWSLAAPRLPESHI